MDILLLAKCPDLEDHD